MACVASGFWLHPLDRDSRFALQRSERHPFEARAIVLNPGDHVTAEARLACI
jgi:hypothetical protein